MGARMKNISNRRRYLYCAQVCSRNLGIAPEQTEGKAQTAFWAVAERYDLRVRLARNPDWVIQGEVHGPGLQKNKARARALQLALFNVWSISERRYLDYEASHDFRDRKSFYVVRKSTGDYASRVLSSHIASRHGSRCLPASTLQNKDFQRWKTGTI